MPRTGRKTNSGERNQNEQSRSSRSSSRRRGESSHGDHDSQNREEEQPQRKRSRRDQNVSRHTPERASVEVEEDGDIVNITVEGMNSDYASEVDENRGNGIQNPHMDDDDSEVNFPSLNNNAVRSENLQEDGEIVEEVVTPNSGVEATPVDSTKYISMADAEKLVEKSVDKTMKRFEEILAAQVRIHNKVQEKKQKSPLEKLDESRKGGETLNSPSDSTIYKNAIQPALNDEIVQSNQEVVPENNVNELINESQRLSSSSDEINTSDEINELNVTNVNHALVGK